MDPRQKALNTLARFRRATTPAQPPIKETSAEIAELVGMEEYQTLPTSAIDEYRLKMEMHKLEMEKQIQIQKMHAQQLTYTYSSRPIERSYERHAVIHITKEDGSNMLLDFDVQVHMEDGEFHSLIIAAADESVTILKDEFMRRLNEDDMLCKLIYKRIVKLKLLDKAPPPTAHPGSIIKQNGQVFMVAADGTLEPVNV